MRYPHFLTAALLGTTLTLVGCSGPGGDQATGHGFNDTDVSFATDMIQHHAQALQMVDLTLGRDLDPEVVELAEDIRAAQTPEIEKMADWLQDWDKPVPETVRDHANAHGDGSAMEHAADMPGMMSAEEMHDLEAAKGDEFQTMWLEMMVEHHEGAVEMAEEEQADGENAQAVALAEDIVAAQQKEIDTMDGLLGK